MKHFCPLLFSATLLLFTAALFPMAVKAVTISPNSGTMGSGSTSNLTVTANPVNGETLVKLDLNFTNATVLGFTPNNNLSTIPPFPECSNGQMFTSSSVCVTFSSSQALPAGATLGTVNVRWGSLGTATIVATTGNLYRLTTDRIDSGVKATYTVGSSGIPNTPLTETQQQQFLLIAAGSSLIFAGIYFKKTAARQRLNTK